MATAVTDEIPDRRAPPAWAASGLAGPDRPSRGAGVWAAPAALVEGVAAWSDELSARSSALGPTGGGRPPGPAGRAGRRHRTGPGRAGELRRGDPACSGAPTGGWRLTWPGRPTGSWWRPARVDRPGRRRATGPRWANGVAARAARSSGPGPSSWACPWPCWASAGRDPGRSACESPPTALRARGSTASAPDGSARRRPLASRCPSWWWSTSRPCGPDRWRPAAPPGRGPGGQGRVDVPAGRGPPRCARASTGASTAGKESVALDFDLAEGRRQLAAAGGRGPTWSSPPRGPGPSSSSGLDPDAMVGGGRPRVWL